MPGLLQLLAYWWEWWHIESSDGDLRGASFTSPLFWQEEGYMGYNRSMCLSKMKFENVRLGYLAIILLCKCVINYVFKLIIVDIGNIKSKNEYHTSSFNVISFIIKKDRQ